MNGRLPAGGLPRNGEMDEDAWSRNDALENHQRALSRQEVGRRVGFQKSSKAEMEGGRKRKRMGGRHTKRGRSISRMKRNGQATMTQIELVRRLRGTGVSVVGAEEFQKGNLRECFSLIRDIEGNIRQPVMTLNKRIPQDTNIPQSSHPQDYIDDAQIPSPPSLSGDDDFDDDVPEGVEMKPTSGLLFEEESIISFAHPLKLWMAKVKDDVRSAHVELLRARLLEILRSNRLNKAYSELRLMRSYAKEAGSLWPGRFNGLLRDIQHEMKVLHGKILDLKPLQCFSNPMS